MRYIGSYELQPLNSAQQSFHRKAIVEMWDAGRDGISYTLKSYGTMVCAVKPITSTGTHPAIYDVAVNTNALSAPTLRHVKEFLAQTDDVFRGIPLDWLRNGEKTVDNGAITRYRKLYAMHKMQPRQYDTPTADSPQGPKHYGRPPDRPTLAAHVRVKH